MTNSKSFCFVQLTRIGDIIQTIQSAMHLKNEMPDIKLILIVRKQFSNQLSFIIDKVFDKCFYIDFNEHIKSSLEISKKNIKSLTDKINNENITILINQSFSTSSSYLCSLINANYKLGSYYDNSGHMRIEDKWSQYIFSSVLTGPLTPFNLVDLHKKVIGISSNLKESDYTLDSALDLKKEDIIVVHPFSSSTKKNWKANKWVDLIYKLLKENSDHIVYIAGSENELDQSNEISNSPFLKQHSSRLFNITGKTSLSELSTILRKTKLFIGHDSMVGHLASINKTQSVTISLGSSRPHETVPYGQDNYIISPRSKCYPCFVDAKCNMHKCHADISYQVVSTIANQLLQNKEVSKEAINQDSSHFHTDTVDIYKTAFTANGLLELNPITKNDNSLTSIFSCYYNIIWPYYFNKIGIKSSFPIINKKRHEELLHYLQGIQYLYELAEFGKKYSQMILQELNSENIGNEKIHELSLKLDELENLQQIVKEAHPALTPLIDHFRTQRGNLVGNNVVELSESSYISYYDLSSLVSTLYDLIEQTITEYKIKNSNKQLDNY